MRRKFYGDRPRGTPPSGELNPRGVAKYNDFGHGKGQFWGEKGCPTVKYRDTPRSSVQKRLNRSRCRLDCGLGLAHGITNYRSPNGKGQFWMKGMPIVNIGTFCRELCKSERLNRSICRLGLGGPKEAHVQSYSPGGVSVHNFSGVHQVAPMCPTTFSMSCATRAQQ